MFEKILQKLKEQRAKTSNVSDRSLEDLARTLVPIITTDELLTAADFSATISSIDGNINHYTADQVKKTKEAWDKDQLKLSEKAKKDAEKKAADAKAKKEGGDGGEPETPEWAKALIEQNQKLASDMDAMKGVNIKEKRLKRLNTILEGTPDFLQNPIKANFGSTNFEDEDSFTTYLEAVEEDKKTFIQAAKENGLNISTPGKNAHVPKDDGQTTELSLARSIANKAKVKQKQKENGTD